MTHARRAVVVLSLLATLFVGAQPALGEQGTFPHWYRNPGAYSTPPIDDRNVTVRQGMNLFANAATYWSTVSGSRITPFLRSAGGNPWDCSPRDWTIVVCVANLGANSVLGDATVQPFDGTHTLWAVLRINAQRVGGFSDEWLIRTVRHELGHALGLNHYMASGQSVMAPVPSSGYANVADQNALTALYSHGH